MPKTISADGKQYSVPDDATDDEINEIVGAAPAAAQSGTPPTPIQKAFKLAPPPESPTGDPKSGFTGLRRGIMDGVGHMIAHPIDTFLSQPFDTSPTPAATGKSAGMVQAVRSADQGELNDQGRVGVKEMAAHPAYAAGTMVGPAVAGGLMAGGLEGAKSLIPSKISSLIPTKAGASAVFDSIAKDAGGLPVNMTRSRPILEAAQKLSMEGHGQIPAANSLFDRINTINPLDYTEARSRYSALSKLTADDSMKVTGDMKRQMGNFRKAFKDDIGDTAQLVGRGDDYAKAMRDYHWASMLGNVADAAKSKIGRAALGGMGAGTAYEVFKNR